MGEGDADDEDEPAEGRREDDRVDRLAALLGPVDVLEAQPERELVECQPGTDPEQHGHDLAPRWVDRGERDEPPDEHEHDAPHEMVDVQVAARHASGPPRHLGRAHQPRARADEQERHEERDERQQRGPRRGGPGIPVPQGDLEVDRREHRPILPVTTSAGSRRLGSVPLASALAMAPLKQKGDLAEMLVAADLVRRGYKVALPFGEDWDYDLIVERGDRLERVQVKYTESNGAVICVRARTHSLTNGRVIAVK